MNGTGENNVPKKQRDRIGIVLYLFYLVLLVAGLLIMAKIAWIQVFFRPEAKIENVLTPKTTVRITEAKRGNIYDANGKLLAIDCPVYDIAMDCTVQKEAFRNEPDGAALEAKWMAKARGLAEGFAEILGDRSADQYYKLIKDNRARGRQYVVIARGVDHIRYKKIKELPLANEYRGRGGVIITRREVRQYPYGTLARRTIGFVRDENSEVKNTHIGLEGKFDYMLRGRDGIEYLRSTDHGSISNSDSTIVKAQDGKDLYTTLNIDYQEIADAALMEQIRDEQDIEGGCLVLMETSTGAIRAMVNFVRDEKSGEFGEFQNVAIGRKAEPGSVFKTVTLMSVLQDGYIQSLEETLPATNGHVEGTSITDNHIPDFARQHNTKEISVLDGFKISSNYVFATLAVKNYGQKGRKGSLDDTYRFLSNIHSYKLGEAFDFDLDGLLSPTIPDPKNMYWTNTDLASVAYGYSTEETPLHILTFYNAIANGGVMMKPYLVNGPSVLNSSICSRAVADTITRALKAVTEDGTARRLRGAKCSVAGKTGTSFGTFENGQYSDKDGRRKYQGTLVGFFPAEEPKYSVICMVYSKPTSKSFQGGGIPARAVRTVIDKIYNIDPHFREHTGTAKKHSR